MATAVCFFSGDCLLRNAAGVDQWERLGGTCAQWNTVQWADQRNNFLAGWGSLRQQMRNFGVPDKATVMDDFTRMGGGPGSCGVQWLVQRFWSERSQVRCLAISDFSHRWPICKPNHTQYNHVFVRCHGSRQDNFHEKFNMAHISYDTPRGAERHVFPFRRFPGVLLARGTRHLYTTCFVRRSIWRRCAQRRVWSKFSFKCGFVRKRQRHFVLSVVWPYLYEKAVFACLVTDS